MNYWIMQLQTDKKPDDIEMIKLLKSGFIGIELEDCKKSGQDSKPLTQWTKDEIAQCRTLKSVIHAFLKIKVSDIVLIRNGITPIALAKIVGNYVFNDHDFNQVIYKHRYPITILEYYTAYQERNLEHQLMPQLCSILTQVIDSRTQSYQIIDKWYKDYSRHHNTHSEYQLRELSISNFKTFFEFKIDGLTQINLITGQNNVGKTSFLESAYINLVSHDIEDYLTSLIKIKKMRSCYFESHSSQLTLSDLRNAKELYDLSIDSNMNTTTFHADNDTIRLEVNGMTESYSVFEIKKWVENGTAKIDRSNVQFIPSFSINDKALSFLFSKIQIARKKEWLNQTLQRYFDENIIEFDIILGEPKLFVLNRDEGWISLSEFGEGIKRLITIICAIWASQEGACFIDEIEDGLHYLHYRQLWEIIFNTAKEANCQIFASTHSKEMIESYYKEAKSIENKAISLTTLVKNKENQIKAISYDFDWLSHEISQNHEVRGW
jgi:AAA15 family ATPase/GTPase